jgi:predicted dithiol-disulfide oxidoreductase (DUF899 family)
MQHDVVSRAEWLAARTNLLAAEKKLAEARAAVQAERRRMPWTRVDKDYVFDAPDGRRSLAELFEGRSKLLVYHFMFAPEWQDGCPGCSQGADHFDGMANHLPRLDASFTAISRAPIDRIESYRRRKGWRFKWVSARPCDFNYDYQVSFPPEAVEKGEGVYGYETTKIDRADLPGTSLFARNQAGEVFHVYSAYTNGGDMPLSANYVELLRL